MKVLVTGAKGFIGRELCRQLVDAGHEVCALDKKESSNPFEHSGIEWEVCDLLNRERMEEVMGGFGPEAIVHLGAKTGLKNFPADSDYFAANTRGTDGLMKAAKKSGSVRRMIFASTKYVWRGEGEPGHREYSPATTYGESKVLMEESIWESDGGCPEWCIVRPTTIWGPGMSSHYQRFLGLVEKGSYFHIGSGKVRKDMGFVGNVAFQLIQLLVQPKEEVHQKVFYLCDYDPVILDEWAEAFRNEFEAPGIRRMPRMMAGILAGVGDVFNRFGWRSFPFNSFRMRNLTFDDLCDPKLTKEVCGDLPYSREEAVKLTVEWFRRKKE